MSEDCLVIKDMADSIALSTPYRIVFVNHLAHVADAFRALAEWSPEDENRAILACLGRDGPDMVLAAAREEVERATEQLKRVEASK